ncbi:hypothetical protein K0B96_06645 [Horticoccus luteus]|uniref:Uncharacterized protein n=1 Tax=Horticoccus luteus TaxID=2862869 RepID=A0A8F9XL30_9BACT|nr:hypothetical protein [Horticoccus luteus]QYM80288.1 hypothetical protein K0B96_06645 [Horticoccus luteus]
MNTARKVIGSHAFFFPDGAAFTVPNPGGVCGRNLKPGATDTGWFDLGVSKWKHSPTHKIEDFDAPSPGARMLYDRIVTRKGKKLSGTLMEMSNLTWQLLMASQELPLTGAGGQYNPLAGDPLIRGWLQLQDYDQHNTLIGTTDYFVSLELPGDVEFGDSALDIGVDAYVLFSPLMTGSLS